MQCAHDAGHWPVNRAIGSYAIEQHVLEFWCPDQFGHGQLGRIHVTGKRLQLIAMAIDLRVRAVERILRGEHALGDALADDDKAAVLIPMRRERPHRMAQYIRHVGRARAESDLDIEFDAGNTQTDETITPAALSRTNVLASIGVAIPAES